MTSQETENRELEAMRLCTFSYGFGYSMYKLYVCCSFFLVVFLSSFFFWGGGLFFQRWGLKHKANIFD